MEAARQNEINARATVVATTTFAPGLLAGCDVIIGAFEYSNRWHATDPFWVRFHWRKYLINSASLPCSL